MKEKQSLDGTCLDPKSSMWGIINSKPYCVALKNMAFSSIPYAWEPTQGRGHDRQTQDYRTLSLAFASGFGYLNQAGLELEILLPIPLR